MFGERTTVGRRCEYALFGCFVALTFGLAGSQLVAAPVPKPPKCKDCDCREWNGWSQVVINNGVRGNPTYYSAWDTVDGIEVQIKTAYPTPPSTNDDPPKATQYCARVCDGGTPTLQKEFDEYGDLVPKKIKIKQYPSGSNVCDRNGCGNLNPVVERVEATMSEEPIANFMVSHYKCVVDPVPDPTPIE